MEKLIKISEVIRMRIRIREVSEGYSSTSRDGAFFAIWLILISDLNAYFTFMCPWTRKSSFISEIIRIWIPDPNRDRLGI